MNLNAGFLNKSNKSGCESIVYLTFVVDNLLEMKLARSFKFIFFILLGTAQMLCAQHPWHYITVRRSDDRKQIQFFDRQNGLVIVRNELQKTIDGGLNWYNVDFGPADVNGVHILDSRHAFVVDDDGYLYKTQNSGESWQTISQKTHALEFVHFADTVNGVACWRDFVYTSNDGGQTWVTRTLSNPQTVRSIYRHSSDTVFAGRFDGLYHSVDGGSSWVKNSSFSTGLVEHFSFVNDSLGFAINQGELYKTVDGGINWLKVTTPASQSDHIGDVDFFDESLGAASGRKGWVMVTKDGGSTWQRYNDFSINLWDYIDVVDQNTIVVSGEENSSAISDDFGSTWKSLTASLPFFARNAHFFNLDTGVIVSDQGRIYRTTNGAASLQEMPSPTDHVLLNVVFTDLNNGIAFGDSGTVISTRDGGFTWQLIPNNLSHHRYFKSFVLGRDSFYLGDGSVLLRSFDGGRSFDSLTVPDPYIKALHFKDSLNGIFLADLNIYTTDDGGGTWQRQKRRISPQSGFTCMGWLNDSVGFLDTYYDSLFKSVDYGRTWQAVLHSDVAANECIPFSDTLIYLRDGGNTPNRTYNGGTTVLDEYACSIRGWGSSDMDMIGPLRGYVVGGEVLRRAPDSIMDISTSKEHYCPGSEISVALRLSGDWTKFQVYSSFDLQLSDNTGSFASPVVIGSWTTQSNCDVPAQFLNGTIPSATPNGNYFIRVISNHPNTIGPKIPIAISNQPNPDVSISNESDTLCGTQNIRLSLGLIEAGSASIPSWYVNGSFAEQSYIFTSDSINDGDTISVMVGLTAGDCYGDTVLTDTMVVTVSGLPQPQISAARTKLFCPGDSILLNAGSFSSYRWNTGSTAQSVYVKKPGSYTVEAKNSYGCSGFDTLRVTQLQPLEVNTQKTNETCLGEKNGSIVLNITGGTAPYSISWQDSSISVAQRDSLSSGVYYFQITDSLGCDLHDSVMISSSPIFSEEVFDTICAGTQFLFPSGDTAFSSVIDTSILTSSYNCDSVIITHLKVLSSTNDTVIASVCKGDSIIFDGAYYSKPGIFTDSLVNGLGCDSIRTLNLSQLSRDTVNQQFEICANDTIQVGANKYFSQGNFSATLSNSVGCDSIVNTTIDLGKLNDSIYLNSFTLTAQATGVDYQWLDCEQAFTVIPSETNRQFSPKRQGRYAVIVTDGTCTDTSSCIDVQGIGLADLQGNAFALYPNPNEGEFYMEVKGTANHQFELYNSIGKKFPNEASYLGKGIYLIKTQGLPEGAYFLRILSDEALGSVTFIKQ